MSKQIYFDSRHAGLIQVKNLRRDEGDERMAFADISKTGHGYRAGETISDFAYRFVHKTRVINGHQYIKPVLSLTNPQRSNT